MKYTAYYPMEWGVMGISCETNAITEVFCLDEMPLQIQEAPSLEGELMKQCADQLREYFDGKRKGFDVALAPKGTDFQQKVWRALQNVPYGETRTYGEIAAEIGNPKASRAVGMANNRNPIMILIPCHRIIGTNGKLVGYAGGLARKQALLDLEQKHSR